uniref:Uncharacterized protein n=1 Tax=Lepeophtheirus salmonis TaxID=72036 RepID=A0A0K2T3N7_LEPSM
MGWSEIKQSFSFLAAIHYGRLILLRSSSLSSICFLTTWKILNGFGCM